MRVIIAGSRSFDNNSKLMGMVMDAVLKSKFQITEVVSGGALGVDMAGENWAHIYGVPVKLFIPDWNKYGKSAGMIRNADMVEYADALIVLWDGKSKGTANTIKRAKALGIPIYEHFKYEPEPVQLSLFGEF
jgi:SLOG family YspA-like protein